MAWLFQRSADDTSPTPNYATVQWFGHPSEKQEMQPGSSQAEESLELRSPKSGVNALTTSLL